MTDASEKLCVLCGESCVGQPRTKDRKGQYYHQSCHDRAVRAKQERARQQEQAVEQAFVTVEPPAPGTDNDNLMSMLLNEAAQPTAPPSHELGAGTCPACGQSVEPDAVLCVNCGFNLQSGQAVHTAIAAAPIDTTASGSRKTVWPIVVGAISVVYAGVNLGLSGLNVLQGLSDANVIQLVVVGFFVALDVWLLVAGIGVLRRMPGGIAHLRLWAIVKTILMSTCFALIVVLFMMAKPAFDKNMPLEVAQFAGFLVGFLIVVMIWELFWPVFCFVWTGRTKIQEEVSDWP